MRKKTKQQRKRLLNIFGKGSQRRKTLKKALKDKEFGNHLSYFVHNADDMTWATVIDAAARWEGVNRAKSEKKKGKKKIKILSSKQQKNS